VANYVLTGPVRGKQATLSESVLASPKFNLNIGFDGFLPHIPGVWTGSTHSYTLFKVKRAGKHGKTHKNRKN
jgi:hypothetical protein